MEKIAYYLGQYHSLEENNAFWGEGFTEWHNVAKARPLFPSHRQPVLPGKLGFYDLRNNDTIEEQVALADSFGVTAFCHWHYWFGGKRVLYRPFDSMLKIQNSPVKVMLGWANESWTGIWHGLSDQVIFEQPYNKIELNEHAKLLADYFRHENYLKVNGKAAFLIYKPRKIPESKSYLQLLRQKVYENCGLDMYIIGTWGPGRLEVIHSADELGLDALVANNVGATFKSELSRKLYNGFWTAAKSLGLGPELRNYASTVKTLEYAHQNISGTVHSTIVTGWDNSPRSNRRALVLTNFNENSFKYAIDIAISNEKNNENKLLFIKSWNEWAEGNTLEPRFKEDWSLGKVLKKQIIKHDV
ncbi:glycoside hydrolase family 99-like domain-containing protein [Shewanella loihica]|nr:glycoside hydrolase family 99-like domain-containing protein [Shewanella loihica]